ncbi:MAG: DUF1003 domain-containing protein [Acidobacteriota bacterium]
MAEGHSIAAEIARLTEIERQIIDRFIHRQRVARDISESPLSPGERIADHVAAFGGSWPFILIAVAAIGIWLAVNLVTAPAFDPYPFILLNLVLSCLAALQAPIIMMSQNRQSAHDRIDAKHDYEVNVKAEIEILALHSKLDEMREAKWTELVKMQEAQLTLLTQLLDRERAAGR